MGDAETRVTANGTAHTRFSLATNVSWKDEDSGEYKTRTEWHRIVVWGKFGEWAGLPQEGRLHRSRGRTPVSGVSAQWFRREDPHRRDPCHIDLDARSCSENGTRRRNRGCGIAGGGGYALLKCGGRSAFSRAGRSSLSTAMLRTACLQSARGRHAVQFRTWQIVRRARTNLTLRAKEEC